MNGRLQQDARHREAVRAYYATGNEALLGSVLADLRPRLLVFLKGKGIQDAERRADLVQETLVVILTELRAHKYAGTGSVTSWALTICWHCFTDSLKTKKNAITQPGTDEDPFLLLAISLATPPEDLPSNQEEEQRAGAVVAAATHAVLGLDPNARTCVLLHYYQGYTVEEIAQHLCADIQIVQARLSRGLLALQQWGKQYQNRLTAEVYTALPRLDSGTLFQERSTRI